MNSWIKAISVTGLIMFWFVIAFHYFGLFIIWAFWNFTKGIVGYVFREDLPNYRELEASEAFLATG